MSYFEYFDGYPELRAKNDNRGSVLEYCARCGHPYASHAAKPEQFDDERYEPKAGYSDSLIICLSKGGYEAPL